MRKNLPYVPAYCLRRGPLKVDRDKAIYHWNIFLDNFTEPDPDFFGMVEDAREKLKELEG